MTHNSVFYLFDDILHVDTDTGRDSCIPRFDEGFAFPRARLVWNLTALTGRILYPWLYHFSQL